VYEVRNTHLDRFVAIKVLPPHSESPIDEARVPLFRPVDAPLGKSPTSAITSATSVHWAIRIGELVAKAVPAR
jgi:hypothetical protein